MITIRDIQQLKSYKVLVIGDSCIDIYKYGSVERICPEAPVPIFKYINETSTEGMAGNVYNNLKCLGINVDIFTNTEVIKKIRYVDQKTNYLMLREDIEHPIKEKMELDTRILNEYDIVIISDYDKGFVDKSLYENIRKNFNRPIFVDSKKKDLSIFENSIIKINESENKNLTNIPENSEIVVTLGGKGASYKGNIYPAKEVKVFDVSGAGDSFLSGLVAGYLMTNKIEDSISFANICAANVVKKPGTAKIDIEEVKNDICF